MGESQGGSLRIGNMVTRHDYPTGFKSHPLLEEGILRYKDGDRATPREAHDLDKSSRSQVEDIENHGPVQRNQMDYTNLVYL